MDLIYYNIKLVFVRENVKTGHFLVKKGQFCYFMEICCCILQKNIRDGSASDSKFQKIPTDLLTVY